MSWEKNNWVVLRTVTWCSWSDTLIA